MIGLKEKGFIKGDKNEITKLLLISEDCNGFIDSILDKIYELDLTKEEEKKLDIEIYREKSDNSWIKVKFAFGPDNTITFSRHDSEYNGKIYRTHHKLTCEGQLFEDNLISLISGTNVIGNQALMSYEESSEILNFNQGIEKKINIREGKNKITHYSKLGFTKKYVYKPECKCYHIECLERGTYKEKLVDDKITYFGLDGKPLKQPELIATNLDSFDDAYTSFNDKLNKCRELIDAKLKEITDKKTR